MTYNQYLATAHWADLAQERKMMAQYRCERCGRSDRRLDCHHLRYRGKDGRSLRFREELSDLQVLCAECHMMLELIKRLSHQGPDFGENEIEPWMFDYDEDDAA